MSSCNQSIGKLLVVIAFGVIIDVINPLLSFANASFLNPSATRDIWPKFEFELVIDASPPDCASKCLLYPIANTDTIWRTASLTIDMCVVSHPVRYIAPESRWYTVDWSKDEDCVDNADPFTVVSAIPSYNLFVGLYFTNALSSFCSEIPVNWATTIERNPFAFLPSAFIPCIPNTDRKEQLKMYGEAPDTVSVSIVIVAEEIFGVAGKFSLTKGRTYVNCVLLATVATFVEIL